ncbi:methyltransferase domain-containing protein [Colletotrichum salicis]|uniref:Methyltransferase domain-containing protein n=1 Tax=Colletotrichum salicis TaxID=1209931 RepID=A0A135UXC0_9PEZI|nr:methyltransferase domain-containing protein [Colletotrichum salicis]
MDNETACGRVLDVGTGSGIWAVNFADDHPEAEIDDVEEEWTWSRPFNYIHSRVMTGAIDDWDLYPRRCYEHQTHSNLEPGGWIELQELDVNVTSDDGTLTPHHVLSHWSRLLAAASQKLGRPYIDPRALAAAHDPTTGLAAVGFVDVSVTTFKWPLNEWPKSAKHKQLGRIQLENGTTGMEAFTMAAFTRAFKWTPEAVNVFLVDVRNDLRDRDIHAYMLA